MMNRVVVITGASRGLGLSLSREFVKRGDTVFGVSRSRKYWKVALASVPNPKRFFLEAFDLKSEVKVRNFFRKVKRKAGKVDLLINNAGYGGNLEHTEDLSSRELLKNLKENLFTAFLTSKYVLPIFRKQKHGFVMNVSSMAGTRAVPKLFAYSASKFGVLALSQCLAKENPDWDFKCVTVCPGGMNTVMRASLFGKEDAARQQSPDFVADIMMQVIDKKIEVESGGHIVIRHSKVTGIFPCPSA